MNLTSFSKQNSNHFDFLFIGLGAANCLLISQLSEKNLLEGKTIGIIEPQNKSFNDRTFCFWATDEEFLRLKIESLISTSWSNIMVNGVSKQAIEPYKYFHVKAIDLYNKTKSILSHKNVVFFNSELTQPPIILAEGYELVLDDANISANKVFDSRSPSFFSTQKNQSHLLQSFIGWKIETSSKVFDPSTLVMMDFSIPQNGSCQFMYILPFSETSALLEVTRFGNQKISKEETTRILDSYINDLGISYEISEIEQGVIPMSSAKIKVDDFGDNWINTGARANMIKSSTGYAFHAMAEDALLNAESIQENELFVRKEKKSRFKFYDRLLLKILDKTPDNGKMIFEVLFKNVPVPKVLKFLREKTSIWEDISIFSKLPHKIFIQTAINDLHSQKLILKPSVFSFIFTTLVLFLSLFKLDIFYWVILGLGFFTIGLSHGAVDHLTDKKIANTKQLIQFTFSYLFKGALLGLVWLWLPDLALLIFIVYSGWHFGQADFKEWKLTQGWKSLSWGISVLMLILFFHYNEFVSILNQIPGLQIVKYLSEMSQNQILLSQILIASFSIFLVALNKSKYMIWTLGYVFLSSMLPLLVSFGIYFVGQHSLHGWKHLQIGLNMTSYNLWLKSLPFSLAGAFIIISMLFLKGTNVFGVFFILLSCISIPHVFSMHSFYSKINLLRK
jgi:lycopene beta-cyclase